MDKAKELDLKRLLKHLKNNNHLKPDDQNKTVDELFEEMFGEDSEYAEIMIRNECLLPAPNE